MDGRYPDVAWLKERTITLQKWWGWDAYLAFLSFFIFFFLRSYLLAFTLCMSSMSSMSIPSGFILGIQNGGGNWENGLLNFLGIYFLPNVYKTTTSEMRKLITHNMIALVTLDMCD